MTETSAEAGKQTGADGTRVPPASTDRGIVIDLRRPQARWDMSPEASYTPATCYGLASLISMTVAGACFEAAKYTPMTIFLVLSLAALGVRIFIGGHDAGYRQAIEDALPDPLDELVSRDLPAPTPGAGYLYVIRFGTGVVKVGQTTHPRRRTIEHRSAASGFKVPILSLWISPPHTNYLANELSLIASCLQVSTRARREYFLTVPFEDAVRFAEALPFLTATEGES